ncbi:MAG: class I SAM-dependent methyltransferase [Caldilineales bacterium]|nr:class I SAM-dependent methyltransferase [Caldilineales bacterium]
MNNQPERGTPAWWDERYGEGERPWDRGIVAPEVLEFASTHPGEARWALDIGCGSGAHSRELARQGYRVIGIDLSQVALTRALRAARAEGLSWMAVKASASDLALCRQSFALGLDVGCLHTLNETQRHQYARGLARRLDKGAHYLLYAVHARQDEEESGPPGLEPEQIETLFKSDFSVERHDRGWQGERRADWWLWKRR